MYGAAKRFARYSAFLSTFVLVTLLFVHAASAANLSQTYTMKNGISFKYPSGWTAMENPQVPGVGISLMNPAQPTTSIMVTVTDGVVEGGAPLDEKAVKEQLAASGQGVKLLNFKKTSLAGKDATLTEYSAEIGEISILTRSVMLQDGGTAVTVTSVYMDKARVAEGQAISEAVEKSLSLK
ncbi:MAG: hypothetical protein LBT65_02420 [Synergistaceae bacterium]|jgi:hypothetical protein|nr:hypothetical protein [Synergistaceae bacterium]